jgi:hypothetical protein
LIRGVEGIIVHKSHRRHFALNFGLLFDDRLFILFLNFQ